jgi:plastocyanin domain-containing protein
MHTRRLTYTLLLATSLACTKPPAVAAAPVATKPTAPTPRTIALKVTEAGFEPANHTVKKGEPLSLVVTRTVDGTCATELLIDGTDINVPLPLNTPVQVAWTPTATGSIKYGCAMDKMVGGVMLVE